MMVRLKGKIDKKVFDGERGANFLIEIHDRSKVSARVDKSNPVYEKLKEGEEVDLICNLKVRELRKNNNIFYNNIIHIALDYNDVDTNDSDEYITKFKEFLGTQKSVISQLVESDLPKDKKAEIMEQIKNGAEQAKQSLFCLMD